jgi:iron complex outermembrane receptor protein
MVRSKNRVHYLLSGSALLATLLIASSADAQAANNTAPAADAQDSRDIIVTAQRRTSTLNDTPAAIAAISAAGLQASGALDSITLQSAVPGLQIARDTGLNTEIYIRGIGNNIGGIGASNSVATYVDGVYISSSIDAFQRFNDVERIEVLKGPQAVLYGRNATGGALIITLKAPSFHQELNADVSYGNYNTHEARASISGGLVGDTVAGRISARVYHHDGYTLNLTNGLPADNEDDMAVRGALLFQLAPNFSVTLQADHSFSRNADITKVQGPNAWQYVLVPSLYVADPRKAYYDVTPSSRQSETGEQVRINWNLGFGSFTSVTSNRDFRAGPTFTDLDGFGVIPQLPTSPTNPALSNFLLPNGQVGETNKSNGFWHETVFTSDASKPLSFIIGGDYSNETAAQLNRRLSAVASGQNGQPLGTAADRQSSVTAFALFGQATFSISSRLKITGGLRYSNEHRFYSSQALSVAALPLYTPTGAVITNQRTDRSVNPQAGIEFRRVPGELWYANYTTGFKSGGFNETSPLNTYSPEKVKSFDGGVKKNWGGGIQTNLSGFYYDYKDLQFQRVIFPSLARQIDNAATAKIYGVEFEASARLMSDFRVGINVAYTHSAYGDLILCNDFLVPCANPSAVQNVSGHQLVRSPELTVGGHMDIGTRIGAGHLGLHLDALYTSRTEYSPFGLFFASRDPFVVVNGQLKYDINPHFYVALFSQNLLNKDYFAMLINGPIAYRPDTGARIGSTDYFGRYAPPRTFGIRVGVSF